jgi:hypothetical protein
MRYQKHFVQSKMRVLGEAHSRSILSNQKYIIGRHIIHNKKDEAMKFWKGKPSPQST